MTDEPAKSEDPPQEPADAKPADSLWAWSLAEQRQFLITLLATVGGALIAAALIGVALGLGRFALKHPEAISGKLGAYGFGIPIAVLGAILVIATAGDSPRSKTVVRVCVAIIVAEVLFVVLIFVGIAAGIK